MLVLNVKFYLSVLPAIIILTFHPNLSLLLTLHFADIELCKLLQLDCSVQHYEYIIINKHMNLRKFIDTNPSIFLV